MKKLMKLVIVGLVLFISSCNNAQKNTQEDAVTSIEVVAPKAMYEILKNNPNAQLIDVRTDQEYGASHLKNSQNICVTEDGFKEKAATLNKDEPVYVYCKSGGRSARAAKVLEEMGFTKIYDLQGGITAWGKEQLETVE